MPDDSSDIASFLPRKRSPWVNVILGAVAIIAVGAFAYFYDDIPNRGPTLRGEGYVIVLPNGQSWAMLSSGNAVLISPDSAKRLNVKPGRCSSFEGSVENNEVDLSRIDCKPGDPVLPAVVDRMRYLHAKFGYWSEDLKPDGDDLEPYLLKTPEVVAAVIDPRADDAQIVPLYIPLFPATLKALRETTKEPPVIISIRRNDLLINRYLRAPLDEFLKPDHLIFAGAAHNGGWLVRELLMVADGTPTLERLLVAPAEAPWPEKMKEKVLRVARIAPAPIINPSPDAQFAAPDANGG